MLELELSALRVNSSCGYGTGTVLELRKRNARNWKPVPEDWLRDNRLEILSACSSELQSVRIGDSATVNFN
jgi:hypothetical protein